MLRDRTPSFLNRSPATLVVLGLLLAATAAVAQGPPDAMPPARIVAFELIQQEVTAGQTFVGTVMPVKRATIGSAVGGRVIEFPHKAGERVSQGDMLAQLLTSTISLEATAAEQELALRQAQLAELVNGTRPEEIEQRRAERDGAAARERFLRTRRVRMESARSASPGTVTEDQLQEAQAAEIEANEAVLAATAAFELAKLGPRDEQIAQAQAQVAMQEAVVQRLHDQITKHTIISRFDGYVVAEFTEIGAWVNSGDPVAEVAAIDDVDVEVQVVEQAVPFVHLGEEVRIEIPALADRIFSGKVVHVVPQADLRARTFPVKIRVANEITEDGPVLKAGMYARAALPVGAKQMAILAPKDAVVLGKGTPMVYVVQQPDGAKSGKPAAGPPSGAAPGAAPSEAPTATPVPVQLGVARGELIQLIGPLQPGQLVVVEGNERLRPGQSVDVTRVVKASQD